jgi:hypothetical protein
MQSSAQALTERCTAGPGPFQIRSLEGSRLKAGTSVERCEASARVTTPAAVVTTLSARMVRSAGNARAPEALEGRTRMSGGAIRDHPLCTTAGGRPNINAYLQSAALLKLQFVSNGPPPQGRRSHAAPARLKPPSCSVRTPDRCRCLKRKPGAVSRPGTNRQFQFHECSDLHACVKRSGLVGLTLGSVASCGGRGIGAIGKVSPVIPDKLAHASHCSQLCVSAASVQCRLLYNRSVWKSFTIVG